MSWISEGWNYVETTVSDIWEEVKNQFDEWTDLFVWSMNEFWSELGTAFLWAVGLTIGGTILETWGIMSWLWDGITRIGGWIADGWAWLSGWGTALYNYWKEFLDWMNFEQIKDAHDIGQIVSPEYREAVQKVYGEIANVSEQLGLGAGFMMLALSDARNLILDASSLFGHPYDMAEAEWVGNLGGYLMDFSDKAETYKNNPEGLLLDIQSYFEPDVIRARSGFQITILEFMDASIQGLTETGKKLSKLKDTVEQTILHLPEQISRPIYNRMWEEFDTFDRFMDDKFTPAINNVSAVTDILLDKSGTHGKQIEDISGLLSNPGEVLANINELPEIERLRQEGQITEISTRSYRTESVSRNEAIDAENEEISRIADALKQERKPPEFLRLEYEGKPLPVTEPSGVFVSWQVGDY